MFVLFCMVVCWDRTEISAGFRAHPHVFRLLSKHFARLKSLFALPLLQIFQGFAFLDLLWELFREQHKPNYQVVSLTFYFFKGKSLIQAICDMSWLILPKYFNS